MENNQYVQAVMDRIEMHGLADEGLQGHIATFVLRRRAERMLRFHQLATIQRTGELSVSGILYNPLYPFLTPLRIATNTIDLFKKESFCFLWYLLDLHVMCFSFNLEILKKSLEKCVGNYHDRHIFRFYTLFGTIAEWQQKCTEALSEDSTRKWGLMLLGRKCHNAPTTGSVTKTMKWLRFTNEDFCTYYKTNNMEAIEFRRSMFEENGYNASEVGAHIEAFPVELPERYTLFNEAAMLTFAESVYWVIPTYNNDFEDY